MSAIHVHVPVFTVVCYTCTSFYYMYRMWSSKLNTLHDWKIYNRPWHLLE